MLGMLQNCLQAFDCQMLQKTSLKGYNWLSLALIFINQLKIYKPMRPSFGLIVLLFTLIIYLSNANSIVSYIVEVEEQARQDLLELTITTTASDKSLEKAISLARQKAQKIKELEEDVCRQLVKDKSQCKGSAEIGNVAIQPKYETIKKQTTFQKITASFTVLIKVQHVQKFGELVDEILKMEGFVIEKIEWIADEDKEQENFLDESLKKSTQLCSELGQNLIRIVKVEELIDKPKKPQQQQKPQEGEEQEEQEEQEEPEEQPEEQKEVMKYRVTAECGGIKQKESKKNKKVKAQAK